MQCQQQDTTINKDRKKKTVDSEYSGLYAFAFAILLAYGMNPSEERFKIDEMRAYLIDCLTNGEIKDLPDHFYTSPRKNEHWTSRFKVI